MTKNKNEKKDEKKNEKKHPGEKSVNENFVKVSLRCPFCLLKGKTTDVINYVHGNCGGELEISNLANIKCQKCNQSIPVSDAIFTDCDRKVFFKDQKEFDNREARIKSDKSNEYGYGHDVFIAVGGQLASTHGRTWLLEFLKNLEKLPPEERAK